MCIRDRYFEKEETVKVPIIDGIAEFFGGKVKITVDVYKRQTYGFSRDDAG